MRGNPGRRPLNPLEPQPAKVIPEPLECLSPAALAHYDRLAGLLDDVGIITKLDGVALSVLAQAIADYEEANRTLARDGFLYTTDSGEKIKSPWILIRKQAFEAITKFAGEFGLTASSRPRLSVSLKDRKNPFGNLAGDDDARFFDGA